MYKPSEVEIRAELQNILNSRHFKSSNILSRFLSFVVEKELAGKSHEIKEYTVGREVLDRPNGFNPQQDASVRIHAFRLRRLLEEYYSNGGAESATKIVLGKGNYQPTYIHSNGHSISEAEKETQKNENWAVPEMLMDSICVLPFTIQADLEDKETLANGFGAILCDALSHFEDISVTSWYSITQYLEQGGDIHQIAKALKATYLLSGRIQVIENEITVTADLNLEGDPMPIWSNVITQDFAGKSVMAIIHEIAEKIISMLVDYNGYIHVHQYGSRDFTKMPSSKTSLAIFWFYHFLTRNTKEIYFEALAQLHKALKEDPDCSMAWAVLGHLQSNGLIYGYETGPEQIALSRNSIEKALELNPDSQHGLLALGLIKVLTGETQTADELFDRCIKINPYSAYFQAGISLGYSMVGQYEKALPLLKKAYHSNPVAIWWLSVPDFIYNLVIGEYRKAWEAAPKYKAAAGILENVFELIALYYLDEKDKFENLSNDYSQKHPMGFAHVPFVLKALFHDPAARAKFDEALSAAASLAGIMQENDQG